MKDYFFELAQATKTAYPEDWYAQRNIIIKPIEVIIKEEPGSVKQLWLYDGKCNLITFVFQNEMYFWWDFVNGETIECSGLERSIGQPKSGKIKTEILWISDPDEKEPVVPRLPVQFT